MRRMRIIPWPNRIKSGAIGYTLVMEWFKEDGKIERDARYQMDAEEFALLKASVDEAAEVTLEDFEEEKA